MTLFVLFIGLIAFGSLSPPKSLPTILRIPNIDKVIHFMMYFVFCLLGIWAKDKRTYKKSRLMGQQIKLNGQAPDLADFLIVLLVAILWGIIMEVAQHLMGFGRSYSMFDLIANILGAFVGSSFYYFLFIRHSGEHIP